MRAAAPVIALGVLLLACSAAPPAGDQADAARDADLTDVAGPDAGADAPPDVPPVPQFGSSVALTDPAIYGAAPALAVGAGGCLVAWHEFPDAASSATRLAYTLIVDGTPGERRYVAETLERPLRPAVGARGAGWLVAYQATEDGVSVVRAVELDAAGEVTAGPVTVSAPGARGVYVQVATAGDDAALAWTDDAAHFFALRGPGETVAAAPVGTTLAVTGPLNYPHIALGPDGTLYLAYYDGTDFESTSWEVLLTVRPRGGAFAPPVNVSASPGLNSSDIDLALEPDGTVDIVWVDQAADNDEAFEVTWARRSPAGLVTAPARFATQGLLAWHPSVTRGLATVWFTGLSAAAGDLYFAPGLQPPVRILPGEVGGFPVLERDPAGTLHLVVTDLATPRQVRYARAPAPE